MNYELLLFLFIIFAGPFIFLWMREGSKSNKYERAVYIANQKFNFIPKIKEWAEKDGFRTSADQGIDPNDVYAAFWLADNKGEKSIKKDNKEL